MIPASPSASPSVAYGGRPNILRRAEAWLDSKGRKAWIAAMVLGFVFFWPVGLFFVAYITATNRWSSDKMFGCAARKHRHHHDRYAAFRAAQPSGNAAFDSYKSDMLKRLETEQTAFEAFLQRLRAAKDKSEFDAFMEDRARDNRTTDAATEDSPKSDLPRTGEY